MTTKADAQSTIVMPAATSGSQLRSRVGAGGVDGAVEGEIRAHGTSLVAHET